MPGSNSGTGNNQGGGNVTAGDQWGVGPLGDHLHHPAFLAGLGPRESSNPHHPSSMSNNPDQKPLIPNAMLTGYNGTYSTIWLIGFVEAIKLFTSIIIIQFREK